MLPSRLFRNTGIAPSLRALLTPSSSLPATLSTQLRLRLSINPSTITAARAHSTETQAHTHDHAHEHAHAHRYPSTSAEAGGKLSSSTRPQGQTEEVRIEPRLSLTFTCTADDCGHRSTHQFSRHAYEHGIVLIECPGCKNRHLIADHLGWFKEATAEGKLKTVEDLMLARGEKIRRGRIDTSGSIEYAPA